MEELLTRLETQLRELITNHTQLKASNQQLQQNKHHLALEKDILLVRQQKAAAQIELLVSKLKTIGIQS
jgi:uncharacterized protein (TIGR02449 family)